MGCTATASLPPESRACNASVETSSPVFWPVWWSLVEELRPACSRGRTFLWLTVALVGLCTRGDVAGVTSWVRAAFLSTPGYHSLLHVFRSTGVNLDDLTAAWVRLVQRRFRPFEVKGRLVVVGDGIKVGKEGRKMPGVKSLHQESANNSKPEFIMGHSFQAAGLLVEGVGGPACVPLASRLHEGVKASPSEKRTVLTRMVALVLSLAATLGKPVILVADAFYANGAVVKPLLAAGHHLVTRARSNCVAYELAPQPKKRKRGRPRKYGKKIRVADLWSSAAAKTARVDVYGEKGTRVRYVCADLLWRPLERLVRFVIVEHPTRGRITLMTTDTTLDPENVILLYALRFKIESAFKQAVHTVGAYAYHFWLKLMTKRRRGDGNQYLHRATPEHRTAMVRKLGAYDLHAQLGCIAQGLLQFFAIHHHSRVWSGLRSWLRTTRTTQAPSEAVTAQALRADLPNFLQTSRDECALAKFLHERADRSRLPGALAT